MGQSPRRSCNRQIVINQIGQLFINNAVKRMDEKVEERGRNKVEKERVESGGRTSHR